jgi:hypothetical protein
MSLATAITDIYALIYLLLKMDQTLGSPYLTAVLRAPVPELDLSGSQPFSLELVVTLYASKPILLYTADTFLSPPAALRQGGIIFVRQQSDSKPEPRSTIDVNRGHGPDRPWSPNNLLTLEPETPARIQIPFNSRSPSIASQGGHFDFRLWMSTATFQTGIAYKAVLPSAVKVSWWRWATQGEGNDSESVPVLPEEEQLAVYVVDDDATFTCVGHHVAPSTHPH